MDYEKVIKAVTITGRRDNGLCKIKCKKLNNVKHVDYMRYCYVITAILISVFLILNIEYTPDSCRFPDFCMTLIGISFADMLMVNAYNYWLGMTIRRWTRYESIVYAKNPGIAFAFLTDDLMNFLSVEPIDSLFHWIHIVAIMVMSIYEFYIGVVIYASIGTCINMIELQATVRNILSMNDALEHDDIMLSGNPLIFSKDDLEMYMDIMKQFMKFHKIMKIYRIVQFIVCIVLASFYI